MKPYFSIQYEFLMCRLEFSLFSFLQVIFYDEVPFHIQPNFAIRARLSSRAPVKKDEREEELRRYPATKVLRKDI